MPHPSNRALAALGLAAFAATLLLAEPVLAQASGGGNITTFLQNIVNIITGTAGKLVSVIAIAIVGIGWMLGAASARTAGGVVFGVILVFSASWIVDQIVGG
ncbi:MAG: TrbC/VirB2 family protein [Acetobacteraceae bacterium]|nr:TrbC/VirB2 family protein [Acetobacteraceae bacterium]